LLAVWGGVFFVPLPSILLLKFRPPASTAFIEARKARLEAEGKPSSIDRQPVPLSQVSPHLVTAVLAAEDSGFYLHRGIDWEAVKRARAYNEAQAKKGGKKLRGASTLTQQLAKNLYLSGERTLWRKAREAAIATVLEVVLTKQEILAHYLSAIEWGETTYGCQAASRRYFKCPASRLSREQAAWLAAMIPSPRLYLANPGRHQRRAARIARFARAGVPVPDASPESD
jgi:monofunctional biosynthetic peptidoglycan transglycosylase